MDITRTRTHEEAMKFKSIYSVFYFIVALPLSAEILEERRKKLLTFYSAGLPLFTILSFNPTSVYFYNTA